MIDDIRNNKNLVVYLDQLTEVKARLEYISGYSNSEKDRFIVESHALQVRKLIELVAFSLISIHRTKYKVYRANVGIDFKKDWNGKDIINNVLKINPDMFFRPAYPGFSVEKDGTKQVNLRDEKECYSLKKLAMLYDLCGGVCMLQTHG